MMNDYQNDPSSAGDVNVLGLLIGFLSVGLLLFAGLSIYAFTTAHTATTTLNQQKQAAALAAAKAQKDNDDQAALVANESPYRAFTAGEEFGGFSISFPKNWSGLDQEDVHGTNQLTLTLNPEFVKQSGVQMDPAAVRVTLVQQQTTVLLASLQNNIKTGRIKQGSVTVSGIASTDLTGTFSDKKTVRAVYIPVRDKTVVISNEDARYASEFTQILAQAKINP